MNVWRDSVMEREGLTAEGWKIEDGECYCWLHSKTIRVHPHTRPVLFLHEVAHAIMESLCACRQPNHYHGGQWAVIFARLVEKYMKLRDLGEVNDIPVKVQRPLDEPTERKTPSGPSEGEGPNGDQN